MDRAIQRALLSSIAQLYVLKENNTEFDRAGQNVQQDDQAHG
jgi:hypothetical protein